MIIIYDAAGNGKVIRPCPLVSIAFTANKNKIGSMGGSYSITLTGAILPDEGSPRVATGANTPVSDGNVKTQVFNTAYSPRPAGNIVPADLRMGAILHKQNALRELFAVDGQKMEIVPISEGDAAITCYPTVESISFEEGVYISICRYTITLKAEVLTDMSDKVLLDGRVALNFQPTGNVLNSDPNKPTNIVPATGRLTIQEHIDQHGGFVEDFSESWAIEVDEGASNTNTLSPNTSTAPHPLSIIRGYRLTRNMSATGRTMYSHLGRHEAWTQAQSFIHKKLEGRRGAGTVNTYDTYPRLTLDKLFASGFINLSTTAFGGYNHSRTQTIDKTAGTCSTSDTWLLSSGTAYETYTASFSSSADTNDSTVTIDGTIKGLTSISASGMIYGGNERLIQNANSNTPYQNATLKYASVTNGGNFGASSHIYKRIQNISNLQFNPQPKSVTVGTNEFSGEITYNLTFTTAPGNMFDGTSSESISLNDTYPGDVFAVIPVLGRANGPVLQYLGSRTEYRRDVTISLVFPANTNLITTTPAPEYNGTTAMPTTLNPTQQIANNRYQYVMSKPSLFEPNRSKLFNLMISLSPAYEVGIKKYFLSPPVETWNPFDRSYSISLNWTYELDH